MNIEEYIGLFAGIFTTIGVLPQIIKALRTRQVRDINPIMFVILTLGVGLWTVYGILKNDIPIIVTNAISCLLNMTMLILALLYRNTNRN